MYLEGLEKRGIIGESQSEWRNPIKFIRKPNGKIRLVSNLMKLNDITEKDEQMLPTAKDIFEDTAGCNCFSVLDLKDAYHSI